MSLKAYQEEEMEKLASILNRYRSISRADREEIAEILKQAFFQLCTVNAMACHVEDALRQILGEETFNKFLDFIVHTHSEYENMKLIETYPWFE